jgi:predicted permease
MLQDLRFAIRLLVKERWFAAVAIVALSLGIGLNATVFTLVNAVLIRGLPFKDSQDLYMLAWNVKRGGRSNVSYADFKDWRDQTKVFSGLAGWSGGDMTISDDRGMPEQARGSYLTGNAFSVVGQTPLLGRDFRPEDEQRGGDRAVIIGYTIWRNRYGGDPGVIGKLTRVNGQPAVIVGVMPEGMMFPQNTEIWSVFIPNAQQQQRSWRGLAVFGRVHPGQTRRAALTEMETIASRVKTAYPKDYEELGGMVIETFNERFNGGPIRAVFLSMMGAVAFVLLIACANVANLLIVRASARSRELAVRAAIGASRADLIRQMLAESLVIAAFGTVIGLLFARGGIRLLITMGPTDLPRLDAVAMDPRVLLFAIAAGVATAVMCGLVPAVRAARADVMEVLRAVGRSGGALTGGRRLRAVVIVAEVALSCILLVAPA